jgi:hypothetical protein
MSSVVSIVLVACLNTNAGIDTASEAITEPRPATVEFTITADSNAQIFLDTSSCSPDIWIDAHFSIVGTAPMFSATADDSLVCTVRYEDPTGIQGCQFDVGQDSTTKAGFAAASAYKGTGANFPICQVLSMGSTTSELDTFAGSFMMTVAQ